ncbi:MAG: nicotinamide riboside transporter PnuC [Candidatus Symbiothrix sp.]|jgi:nicotinamide mononucleotide transporter|nr:nicotinamide riboside transporter PnuC [Candidatus Symbiothrix sp.]
MGDWLANTDNLIELIGVVFGLIYIGLEVRQKWTMWIFGIISSLCYIIIFYNNQLYAEMGLNFYFVAMSVYGLYCWKLAPKKETEELKFGFLDKQTALKLIVVGALIFALITWLLIFLSKNDRLPHSEIFPHPGLADTFVMTLSILATWMAARKIIECWYLWIVADVVAVVLYFSQELYLTDLLYVVYLILSIVGLVQWRKSVK